MKSEEIIEAWNRLNEQARERYRKEGCTLYASLDAPLALAAWVRRATLEEAARVVCPHCAASHPIGKGRASWAHHQCGMGCQASEIHDLIAKLDREGE